MSRRRIRLVGGPKDGEMYTFGPHVLHETGGVGVPLDVYFPLPVPLSERFARYSAGDEIPYYPWDHKVRYVLDRLVDRTGIPETVYRWDQLPRVVTLALWPQAWDDIFEWEDDV